MSLCTFSSQAIINEKISLDNLFVQEFLPSAPDNCVKVYLYGLYACANMPQRDNSVESFAKTLGLTEDEIITAFYYWKEKGLVQILDTMPLEVKYLPVNNVLSTIRKYKKDKYENFNFQVQELLKTRMITPTEYAVYYDLIEREHIEQDALLMIIKYCANLKGTLVGHSYISTVARNWAVEGVTSCEKVEEKLKYYELINTQLGEIYKALSIKRAPLIEEKDLFKKWTIDYGFDENTIIGIIKQQKKRKLSISFEHLGRLIEKYHQMQLMSIPEINSYEEQKEDLKKVAYEVLKKLGLYYENIEPVIETYVSRWFIMGYDFEGLCLLADFCFKKAYKTLESMNNIITKLYKLGIVSVESIHQYMNDISENDKKIKDVLEKLMLARNVNSSDRTFYKIWTENWNISPELMEYGISIAKGKSQPTVYLNKIFSNFYEKQTKTVEEAQQLTKEFQVSSSIKDSNFKGRSYSKGELNALFDSIDEVEV